MSWSSWIRPAVGAAIVAGLVVRFGAAPFERGLRMPDGWLLMLGVGLTAVATACCAWRWRALATTLGVPLRIADAFAACYRSQFLNATLPAGVLGDLHRGLVHGRRLGRARRALGVVAWDRGLGLIVQAAVTVVAVLVLPTALLRPALLAVLVAALAAAILVTVSWRLGPAAPRAAVLADVRRLSGAPRTLLSTGVASAGVTVCHAVVLAAVVRDTGPDLSAGRLVPLVLVIQLASTVPTNIAGWGPREGAAAWAYAAVGLDASDGLAVSVAYGIIALVATLPGALVLTFGSRSRARPAHGHVQGRPADG